jgi:protease-4
MRHALLAAVALVFLQAGAHAADRFVATPTAGLHLPAAPLVGRASATDTVSNPANLVFLGDWAIGAAAVVDREAEAEAPGSGVGVYAAVPVKIPFLPAMAFGVSVEQLLPDRLALAPDPGHALRASIAWAFALSPDVALGLTWHRFRDDDAGPLDGISTADLGVAAHFGANLGAAIVVRDVGTPRVEGLATQRRYQVELTWRPTGSARFEIAGFAQLGERRLDVDGGLRVGWRPIDGLWLGAELAAERRDRLIDPAFDSGGSTRTYGLRGSLGLELSFGAVGAAAYATFARAADGHGAVLGGSVVARWSGEPQKALVGPGDYMARVEIDGDYGSARLTTLLLGLRRLERDPACRAVLLVIGDLGGGFATAQELRDAIGRLKQAGKKVVASLVAATTRAYYVAVAADQVLLDAGGGIRLQGLSGASMYFKELFDRLGIVAQFEKYAEYKSAPEAYTREGPSAEAKLMHDALFDDTYAHLVADLAADRHRSVAEIKAIIDAGPYTAAEAGKAGLVDAVVEGEDLDGAVAQAVGGRLWPLGAPARTTDERWARPKIAVIYIDGDIVDGKSRVIPIIGTHLVGGDTIAKAVSWARTNPDIEAVVLRIDSPGGSALASELMAREIKATRAVKPVIVSMGDVAASGGYFAAAYGDVVFAEPGTITGSIGIFTGKVDLSGLLGKLGITIAMTTRGAHADQDSLYRPYTDEERQRLKEKLGYYYHRFLNTVATGRNMTVAQVDKIARGRVWTGAQAMGIHLVDKQGGVVDAIGLAKARAGYGEDDEVEIVSLPAPSSSLLGELLELAGRAGSTEMTIADLPGAELLRLLPWSVLLADDGEALARLDLVLLGD